MLFDLLDPHLLAALLAPQLDERSLVSLAGTCRAGWELARAECERRQTARGVLMRHIDAWSNYPLPAHLPIQSRHVLAYAAPHRASAPRALTCSSTRVVALSHSDTLISVWPRQADQVPPSAPVPPQFAFHAHPLLPPPPADRAEPSSSKRARVEAEPASAAPLTNVSTTPYPSLFADDVRVIVGSHRHGAALLYRYADLPAAAAAGAADQRVALQPSMTFYGPPHRPGVAAICCGEPDLVVVFVDGSVAVFDLYTGVKRGEYVPPPVGPRYGVPRCALLGESGHLIVGTHTGHVLVYNTHAFGDPGSGCAPGSDRLAPLAAVVSVGGELLSSPLVFAPVTINYNSFARYEVMALQWSAGVTQPGSTVPRTAAGGPAPYFGGRSAALIQPPLVDNRIFIMNAVGVHAATLEELLSCPPDEHTCTLCHGSTNVRYTAGEPSWAALPVEASGRMVFQGWMTMQRSHTIYLGTAMVRAEPSGPPGRTLAYRELAPTERAPPTYLAGPVLPLSPFASPGHGCLAATAAGGVLWCAPVMRQRRPAAWPPAVAAATTDGAAV